jgi:hypothetical protein
VNYIFHKLSGNTKHVQFQWARGEVLFKMAFKFILLVFFEELHMAETTQGLKDKVMRKKFVLSIESWFSLFSNLFLACNYAWRHLQCDHYDLIVKYLIFFKKFFKVHNVDDLSQDPHQQKRILAHS